MTGSQEETHTSPQGLFTTETSPGSSMSQAFVQETVAGFLPSAGVVLVTFRHGLWPNRVKQAQG